MTVSNKIFFRSQLSIGDAILVSGACLFASWTVFCNIAVLSASSFTDLRTWSFLPIAAGMLLATLCLVEPQPVAPSRVEPPPGKSSPALGNGVSHLLAPLAMAAIAAILRLADAPYGLVWAALTAAAALTVLRVGAPAALHDPPSAPASDWRLRGAGVLIVVGALLAAITHRYDLDDAQFLNFVVTALDYPLEPLLSHSGLWLDRAAPLNLPVYRFHSFELLVAALSHLFAAEHKIFYYLVLPPMFGAAAVLVHWRLARHLAPRHALWVLTTWLVLIIAIGESHRAFGNFAFVRIFQGKAVLASVALPLCLLLGLRFGEAPNWRRAIALGAAVIASLGFSSSALATAPLIVAAALGGSLWGSSRASAARIAIGGFVAVAYLFAIGAILLGTMQTGSSGAFQDSLPGASDGIYRVLGDGILGAIVLALFPVAPLFVDDTRRRRIYAGTTLICVIAVLNPWTAYWLPKLLTGTLQWRLFWSVPFLVSASVALVGLSAPVAGRMQRPARIAVVPLMLIATLLVSSRWSLSPTNRVVINLPRYKVEPYAHATAAEIVGRAPPRSTIYAPISVAAWVTTFRRHPFPVVVRPHLINGHVLRGYFGDRDVDRQLRVVRLLEGRARDARATSFFATQLARDRPALVVYEIGVATAPALRAALDEAGYANEKLGQYWLWQRP